MIGGLFILILFIGVIIFAFWYFIWDWRRDVRFSHRRKELESSLTVSTEEKAIECAKQVAVEEGWNWNEPIKAAWGWYNKEGKWFGNWRVHWIPDPRFYRTSVWVVIDAQTGEVIEKGATPY